ncbi:MAG: KUP/HAK/KT family potassium transporter [Solirubrobacterales bacterium]|nr:KUP/HAK/KT family potassium transporter [Solirubrobacterales bacterium]
MFETSRKGESKDADQSAQNEVLQTATNSSQRRVLHEAAHKLGAPTERSEKRAKPPPRSFEGERDVVADTGRAALVLGALGVVYGDLGTSPLYTEQSIFTAHANAAHATPAGVYGVASLIFWALMVIVSIKYAGFIMRAHNHGDGGIMALTALLARNRVRHGVIFISLGIFGAALFFGDDIITPAISVLGAVQGMNVATPALSHLVVPISVAVLLALFVLQRFGSKTIGWLFGPVLLSWFIAIGAVGLSLVVTDPAVFQALSPSWGIRFLVAHGGAGYLTLGGVVLAVTGAEALYADRGHFGARAIRMGWWCIVLPAVLLNYLGQGAWIIHHPQSVKTVSSFNPFFQMIPSWALWPMVVLATAATIIASQAVISGSFSVAKQATQLGFLPRLRIQHTSRTEGQIYVPLINWGLCVGVLALVLVFRSSNKLSEIYGVAVSGTFVLNTVLFLAVARLLWKRPRWKLAPLAVLFLTVEITFFIANIARVTHGAWLPLAIGLVVSAVMLTWRRGQEIVTRNRSEKEGSLDQFLDTLPHRDPRPRRVPGTAIFLNQNKATTPLALRAEIEHAHAMHEKVVVMSVEPVSVPHVNRDDRFVVTRPGHGLFRIYHVIDRVGYQDKLNVPEALALARKLGLLERNLDLEHADYFLSRIAITPTDGPGMNRWRKKLFVAMARNAASPIEHFCLPSERTVMMGSQVGV